MGEWTWRTSSHSGATNGNCVEIALPGERHATVRDSKNPSQGRVDLTTPAWQGLLRALDER